MPPPGSGVVAAATVRKQPADPAVRKETADSVPQVERLALGIEPLQPCLR